LAATDRDRPAAPPGKVAPASLTALQCELRAMFANRPTNRAIAAALDRIGSRFEAVYAVLHTRLGVHLLSEEWTRPGTEVDIHVRDQVNTALWEAVSTEETRSVRLGEAEPHVLLAVVMYDQDAQPSGGAALLLRTRDRDHVARTMTQLEGILGYLSLLLGDGKSGNRRIAEHRAILPTASAADPIRLAHKMIEELEHRYAFEATAIGFVCGDRVEVAAVSGVEDLRAANPGITSIRAAMEECLDHRSMIVSSAGGGGGDGEDNRLHAQWSAQRHGNPVASFPLEFLEQIVAIVSVSQGTAAPLTREQIAVCAEEMSAYAALVPLSRAANRSLAVHAVDSMRRLVANLAGRGRRRALCTALVAALLGAFLIFGELRHAFTVPCVVKAADRRTISCPRSGVLAELFVRPGDRVRAGQLLAAIDANDDFLRRAEVIAEVESLDAMIDQAVARREAGQIRVHTAKKRSLQAQLVILDASIAEAQIRAPQDGLILQGDLRERLGSRLEMGTPMFELARYDRAAVVLHIPEKLVLAAHEAKSAWFASSARPDQTMELEALVIAPASAVVDERNVFFAEAHVAIDLARLPPGMEGTAYIDAGPRPALWVLTHRITDWLHTNFWL
jgi:biotin carboxyl carrier protein